ncbi:hypothetical protein ASF53_13690 [Methylobacterium sp. Leaf123]|uniref:hypothetical protein n=1 Tax=Methylobacterium sp. Leaf123 TaxID=1736264 RepID=UPI0006F60C63|nr:hypothetical protein [Methylobacterium sp. Leaf123]KQQ13231.1 hypothetical protein ASF53_13690 [Methylobacterium sp. Leaf123]
MSPSTFTKDWKSTRALARDTDRTEYVSILAEHEGEEFEIAKWSRFSPKHDGHKVELYLPVTTTRFGESLGYMLDHTVKTGIGKIVTFRDAPRYVLDPGRQWRSYQAAIFGVTRTQYREAIRCSRVVQRLLDKEGTALRKEILSATSRVEAFEEAMSDMQIDYAAQEQEVRHLRLEVARIGAE